MLRMKVLKTALASMLVLCAMGFYSCSSDDGEPETPSTESSIVGKWDVTNPETRATGDTKYGSFEFTADNKYIITQPAVATNGDKYMLVIFGDYNATGGENNEFALNLKEFGTIKISITENHASITVDGVVYVAIKSENMDLTDSNKKFMGTWKVKSKYEDELEFDDAGTMTFTPAGTYLLMFINETGELQTDNGTWYWKSDNIINVSLTAYCASTTPGYNDPITGEYIPGKTESWVETEFEDWIFTKLTDKEFIAEIDDEGDILTIVGTKE